MDKGIIYYTDNKLGDPIYSEVQKHILASGLPIVSSSLEPIDFGENEVVAGLRGYPTMIKQIISCLERSKTKYVFFCEHDVLYDRSHFDFTPDRDDIFYYNDNVFRWEVGSDVVIKHDRMIPLSSLCANREFTLEHYKGRLEFILERGYDKDIKGNPLWMRRMGFEPGTKKKRRGGFSNDDFDTWTSKYPNIDIRHKKAFSPVKIKIEDFTHPPKWWVGLELNEIINWDLKGMFNGS